MSTPNNIFQQAVSKLLIEIFNGPPGREAYILNPGDAGLIRQLETLSADEASTPPAPGRKTIAAHADHIHYGLALLNRWAAGEPNPWADADWNASWQRTTVSEEQWQSLLAALREQSETWQNAMAQRTEWDDLTAAGALSSVAHTAYHLGAIRQIIASVAKTEASRRIY